MDNLYVTYIWMNNASRNKSLGHFQAPPARFEVQASEWDNLY